MICIHCKCERNFYGMGYINSSTGEKIVSCCHFVNIYWHLYIEQNWLKEFIPKFFTVIINEWEVANTFFLFFHFLMFSFLLIKYLFLSTQYPYKLKFQIILNELKVKKIHLTCYFLTFFFAVSRCILLTSYNILLWFVLCLPQQSQMLSLPSTIATYLYHKFWMPSILFNLL